jgi:plastocyanin
MSLQIYKRGTFQDSTTVPNLSPNPSQLPIITYSFPFESKLKSLPQTLKMRHATPISFFLFSLPLTVLSKSINHDITVGPALSFSPNTTSASAGDTLTFHFFPGKHNVAQSSFSTPCAPSPNGFYSGFIVPDSGEDSTKFVVMVNDTQPIWFYCSEVMHCQLGMVGVVNPTYVSSPLFSPLLPFPISPSSFLPSTSRISRPI